MLEEIKRKSIIDYWRKHFESIIKWEVENGKKV